MIHWCDGLFGVDCGCQNIERVTCTKYLGVDVDQILSWHAHIEILMTRERLNCIFKSLRQVILSKVLNRIYIALARSVIIYCVPVWDGATKTKFLELERAQRLIIKVLYVFKTK